MEKVKLYADPTPVGETFCEQIPGPPLVQFELSRGGIPRASRVIDQLFENSRVGWADLLRDRTSEVLRREEEPDRFRFVVRLSRRGGTTAIEVRRRSPTDLWSHGHVVRNRTVECAFHHYSVRSEGTVGELRDQVELRSTSRFFRFQRRQMGSVAARAAENRLDDIVRELGQ